MDVKLAADLALLSQAVYNDEPIAPDGWIRLGPVVKDISFFAAAFQRTIAGKSQIVVAFRGSEPFWKDPGDWIYADFELLVPWNSWGYQFEDAIKVVGKIKASAPPGTSILVTGHSLGGALAQVSASMFGLDGVGFDPGGALNLVGSKEFTDLATARTDDVDGRHWPSSFVNYIVEYSLVPLLTGSQVETEPPVVIEKDAEVVQYLKTYLAAADLGNPLFAAAKQAMLTVSFFVDLHSIDHIVEYLQAKATGTLSNFVEAAISKALPAAQSGDFGVNDGLGVDETGKIPGSSGPDLIVGNNAANEIVAGDGNDYVLSYSGDDRVFGGAGDDVISTASGNDVVDAGAGNDTVFAGSGDDTINAGTGSDTVDAGSGNDTIAVIAGFTEIDTVNGGTGTDTLTVDASSNTSASITFWGRLNADGQVGIGVDSSSNLQAVKSYLGAVAGPLMFNVGSTSWGVKFDGIENLSIAAPNAANPDLLIAMGTGGSYDGKGGTDTFYADWSAATAGITWINDPAKTATVNGATITGVERLLLQTGSGNDTINNTGVTTSDEIIAGAGDDTINTGAGSDTVDAGSGNDTIAVIAGYTEMDTVHGGTGTDTLTVDASGITGTTITFWGSVRADGQVGGVDSSSSLQAVKSYLGDLAGPLMFNVGSTSWGVKFDGIENLSIAAPTYGNPDLLISMGTGGSYDGKGGTDTFYADWSTATAGITWINDPAKTATVNGVTITGVERLLLQTGSGSDTISNTVANTNDEVYSGAGNDTVNLGNGSDALYGGDGIDTAVFSSARSDYTLSRATTGFTVKSQTGDLDSLVGVERLAFSDRHIALDLQGNAGSTAKIIGAIFGRQYVQNKEFVGIGLSLLDEGMTYPDLAALAVRTDFFAQLAGSRSNTAFVNLVYKNVVGVQPGQADVDYFVGLLDSGAFSQASLALLACETDLNKVNVDLVGLANTGIEYLQMG